MSRVMGELDPGRFREPDYMGCKRERSGGNASPEGSVYACVCMCMYLRVHAYALPVRRALCCAMCYAYGLLWLTKRLSSGRLVCVISAMGVLASGSLRRVTTRVRLRRRRRLRLRRSGQGRGRCEVAADRSFRRFRSISSSATCSSRKESSASAWSSM